MSLFARVIRRIRSSDGWGTSRDLSVFRIVYASATLLILPTAHWAVGLPAGAWDPPAGPLALLSGPPPGIVVVVLEVATAAALALLAIGWRTGAVSVVSGLLIWTVTGLSNSYGQVDHVGLLGAIPLVLAGSGWGAAHSLDARAGRLDRQRPWLTRVLALAIGLAFLSAAIPKLASGWLERTTQSAQGHLLRRVITGENSGPLGELATSVASPAAWELVDVATVLLELGLVVALVAPAVFRLAVSIATLFHLGVLLMLGIDFPSLVIAYGAFVAWTRLGLVRRGLASSRRLSRTSLLALSAAAAVAAIGLTLVPAFGEVAGAVIVVAGAAGGLIHLGSSAARLTRTARRHDDATPSAWGRWAGRILFVMLAITLPVQYWLTPRVGEPYPALQQPGFSQVRIVDDTFVSRNVPIVVVTFADGSTELVSSSTILPSPRLQQSVIFRSIFGGKEKARRPETVAWLEGRLAELFPGRVAVKFRVGWNRVVYSAIDGSVISSEERYDVVVDLGPER